MLQNFIPFAPVGHDGSVAINMVHFCEQTGPVWLNEFVQTPLVHSVLPVSVTVVHGAPKPWLFEPEPDPDPEPDPEPDPLP